MEEVRPAGFWIRVVAAIVDMILFGIVQLSLRLAATLIWRGSLGDSALFHFLVVVFTLVYTGLYLTLLHAIAGQTIGKMVTGIRVVTTDGAIPGLAVALLRYFAYFASLVPFGLGFLMAGLRRDKRALHDLLAGTRVEWLPAAETPVGRRETPAPEAVAPSDV